MYKLIFLALVLAVTGLYFSGALEFDDSGDNINISVDKDKAKALGESIKEQLED